MQANVKIISTNKRIDRTAWAGAKHLLIVLPKATTLPANTRLPGLDGLSLALERRRMKVEELADNPIATTLENGAIAAWVMLDSNQTRFERHTSLRKALQLFLNEYPQDITIILRGKAALTELIAEEAVYVCLVNRAPLPQRKQKNLFRALKTIYVYGQDLAHGTEMHARADGNALARQLTQMPPNELTPTLYRKRIKQLAHEYSWKVTEYDLNKLKKLGAGAFIAVAQGSSAGDAAIVRVEYKGARSGTTIALVGKGICFDTGGHNLKPAKNMQGMHEDMNGSAVVLGILAAATRLNLPINITAWLAIAENHIGPMAYKQNDVVKALNGTTIEVVHTDAEGRMVLADTLTLAAQENPSLLIDFATLTGSMVAALGNRYSGIFSNVPELLQQGISAGVTTGERVWGFPMDTDYEPLLESKIADIKQCTLEADPDHILAARFLSRFVGKTRWLHMDLSASSCEGGLGAVASNTTGFGVDWGLAMLRNYSNSNLHWKGEQGDKDEATKTVHSSTARSRRRR